jgi:hypothetical protein
VVMLRVLPFAQIQVEIRARLQIRAT